MVRIDKILCPVDFSETSRRAFDRAVAVARCYGSVVHVLHVLPVPSVVPAIPYGPEGPGPFHFEVLNVDRVLGELPRFLAVEQPIGVSLDYHVVEAAKAEREILVQAQRLKADLIIMGTHGRSGFDRLLLGSVTERVLRTSEAPVLTVPSHVPDVLPIARDPFRRILYATDFSPGSLEALRYAASLAEHGAGSLTVVHVVESILAVYDPSLALSVEVGAIEASVVEEARKKLPQWVPEFVQLGCDTDYAVLQGTAYAEILRLAAERRADLIVLGVHGRGALDRLVFGSTTEHIVRRATCPVLTVRQ